jgi:hypothetical protein
MPVSTSPDSRTIELRDYVICLVPAVSMREKNVSEDPMELTEHMTWSDRPYLQTDRCP